MRTWEFEGPFFGLLALLQDMEFIFNEMVDDGKRFSAVSAAGPCRPGTRLARANAAFTPCLRNARLPPGDGCTRHRWAGFVATWCSGAAPIPPPTHPAVPPRTCAPAMRCAPRWPPPPTAWPGQQSTWSGATQGASCWRPSLMVGGRRGLLASCVRGFLASRCPAALPAALAGSLRAQYGRPWHSAAGIAGGATLPAAALSCCLPATRHCTPLVPAGERMQVHRCRPPPGTHGPDLVSYFSRKAIEHGERSNYRQAGRAGPADRLAGPWCAIAPQRASWVHSVHAPARPAGMCQDASLHACSPPA